MWENIKSSADRGDCTAAAILAHGPEKVARKFRENLQVKKGGCWELTFAKNRAGYGVICVKRNRYAHRVSFLLHGSEIEANLVLDHKCRNRACVNPAHLRQITNVENVMVGGGFGAKNIQKTHCANGHEYSGVNLYVRKNGHRVCVECRKAALRRLYRRKS